MPDGGKRTPLALSYSWGQSALEAQFAATFQPNAGIFSPGTPLAPLEPEKTRLWDFPVGVNTITTPRAYEPVSFAELRALAESHDLTRLAIETRKDQIEKLDWAIKPREPRRPSPDARTRAQHAAQFWHRPDRDRPFATWLRALLEDVLVLDAPALELRRNRAGDVIGLDVVDGATIKLLVDDTGRRRSPRRTPSRRFISTASCNPRRITASMPRPASSPSRRRRRRANPSLPTSPTISVSASRTTSPNSRTS